jgi:hypothetical protein
VFPDKLANTFRIFLAIRSGRFRLRDFQRNLMLSHTPPSNGNSEEPPIECDNFKAV